VSGKGMNVMEMTELGNLAYVEERVETIGVSGA
jgi:hypothetical protein